MLPVVEVCIETTPDYYAAGNVCVVAGAVTSGQVHTRLIERLRCVQPPAPDPTNRVEDTPAIREALELVAEYGALDVAALAGCILGARAVRLPVIMSGRASAAAAVLASAIIPDAAAVCFPAIRDETDLSTAFESLGLPAMMHDAATPSDGFEDLYLAVQALHSLSSGPVRSDAPTQPAPVRSAETPQ